MDSMHLNIGAMLARAALRKTVRSAQSTARSVAKDVASVAKAHQRQLVGAGVGALAGGGVGYLGASRRADEDERDFSSRRVRNTLIGSAVGGALGGSVGHVTRTKQAPPAAAPAPAPAAAPAAASTAVPAVASRPPRQRPPRQRPPRPPKSERRAAQRRIGGGYYANDELGRFSPSEKTEIRKETYRRHLDAVDSGGNAYIRTMDTAESADGSAMERAAARLALARRTQDRARARIAYLKENTRRAIEEGVDPAEADETLKFQIQSVLDNANRRTKTHGYRHQMKLGALRDRVAMGAGLIGRGVRALRGS